MGLILSCHNLGVVFLSGEFSFLTTFELHSVVLPIGKHNTVNFLFLFLFIGPYQLDYVSQTS